MIFYLNEQLAHLQNLYQDQPELEAMVRGSLFVALYNDETAFLNRKPILHNCIDAFEVKTYLKNEASLLMERLAEGLQFYYSTIVSALPDGQKLIRLAKKLRIPCREVKC